MKKRINLELDAELYEQLSHYLESSGKTQREAASEALRQFLTIKSEERRFKKKHPLRKTLVIEDPEAEEEQVAAVLIY